ncbi:MAG: glycosyltransferase [Bacteroidaceae bacterium]|nr:glycosyltransferase [Bacteroidaceae bacterium]
MEDIISVVVITYNQEEYIARALDSILMQKCSIPFEIIIGEDCSTDNTGEICARYAEQYPDKITLFRNSPNKGLLNNYFDCLMACRGKYMADCAGDDFWVDEYKLEKLRTIMDEHPDVTLAHTGYAVYNENTGVASTPLGYQPEAYIKDGKAMLQDIICPKVPMMIQSTMFRMKPLLEGYEEDTALFRNKNLPCEDMPIFSVLASRGKVAYIPDVTQNYSVGHDSLSNNVDEVKQFHFVRRMAKLTSYLAEKYGIDATALNECLRIKAFALIMHVFRTNKPELLADFDNTIQSLHIQTDTKTKFLRQALKCKMLWKTLLCVRKAFVRLKKRA